MPGAFDSTIPSLFCPRCCYYLGSASICPCGYTRPAEIKIFDVEEPIWRGKLPGAARSRPVMIADEIFFAWRKRQGGPGGVVAFNCNTGVRRDVVTSNYAVENLASNGSLLLVTTHGLLADDPTELICVDLSHPDAREKVISISGGVSTAALGVQNRGYIASGDGKVHVLDFSTLDLLKRNWPVALQDENRPERGKVWLTQFGNILLAACESGRIYALDLFSGKPVWRKPIDLGDQISSPGVLTGTNLFIGIKGGKICAIDLNTRLVKVFNQSFSAIIAGLITEGNRLYVSGHNHEIQSLLLPEGQPAWKKPVEFRHSISSTPAMMDGLLIACANGGEVCAIEAETGAVGWRLLLTGSGVTISDPFFHDGIVYLATEKGDVYAYPWHVGHYAWAASWLEKKGRYEDAANLYAISGDREKFAAEKRRDEYEKAILQWRQACRWDLAAHFREAILDEPAESIALEFENAGKSFHRSDPKLSDDLLRKAISWYEEAEHAEGISRCQIMLMKVAQAFISVQSTLPGEWVADEPKEVVFHLHNKGSVPVHQIRVLLSGTSINEQTWQSPFRDTLQPGESTLISSLITPIATGILNIDVVYEDEHQQELKTSKKYPMSVQSSPTSIEVGGDVGYVKLDPGLLNGKVKIRGDVGSLRISPSFSWPEPTTGFRTDGAEIILWKDVPGNEVKVPDGYSAFFKADGNFIGLFGPGIYQRNAMAELRRSIFPVRRNPVWEMVQFFHAGIRLAFRSGPFENSDKIPVGLELGITVSLVPDQVLDLWQQIGKGGQNINGESLRDWLAPEIDTLVMRWIHPYSVAELKNVVHLQDVLIPQLEYETRQKLKVSGLCLIGRPWAIRPIT